jgi:S1-C subfamily serine protease
MPADFSGRPVRLGESPSVKVRSATKLALAWLALMGVFGCLVVNTPDHVQYPVAGTFANRPEIFWGSIDNNLRQGTAFVQAVGEQTGIRCTGEGHLTQQPVNCVGGKGACHVTCDDGTVVDCVYTLSTCTSGYGVGLDANKNWFAFAFGQGINQNSRDVVSATLHKAASALPAPSGAPTQTASQADNTPGVEAAQNAESGDSSKSAKTETVSMGTGFFVSREGLLITADHVISERKNILVMTRRGEVLEAVVINDDPANDIALLKVDVVSKPLIVESTVKVAVGQDVMTLGYPAAAIQGTEQKATFGHINALSGVRDDVRLMQIDVPIQPGNSGGPLLDDQGRVIGVVTSMLDQEVALKLTGSLPQNVNYATKADYLIPLLSHEGVLPTSETSRAPSETPAEVVSHVRDSVVLVVSPQ